MKFGNSKTHIIDIIIEHLQKNAVGKSNSISGKNILRALKEDYNIDINLRYVEEMISMIRSKWLVKNLIACSRGYYIATNKSEINDYVNKLNSIINRTQRLVDTFSEPDFLDEGITKKPKKRMINDDW